MREGVLLVDAVATAKLGAEIALSVFLNVFGWLLTAHAFFGGDVNILHFQALSGDRPLMWLVHVEDVLLCVEWELLVESADLDYGSFTVKDVCMLESLLLLGILRECTFEIPLVPSFD